ncbi:hypothetical protein BC938DRAFT_477935 [Jimgerdemannia flammicorona]|uniref:VWFA domain-containing protein n=1 Tax=Jimgerdemannia flammicorona TaxID=994334 RepID=A0A433QNP3_9FUNG|nr:hypothetical protein BC938DRAFT_477935 [Jimgerdemannia flammicorona]
MAGYNKGSRRVRFGPLPSMCSTGSRDRLSRAYLVYNKDSYNDGDDEEDDDEEEDYDDEEVQVANAISPLKIFSSSANATVGKSEGDKEEYDDEDEGAVSEPIAVSRSPSACGTTGLTKEIWMPRGAASSGSYPVTTLTGKHGHGDYGDGAHDRYKSTFLRRDDGGAATSGTRISGDDRESDSKDGVIIGPPKPNLKKKFRCWWSRKSAPEPPKPPKSVDVLFLLDITPSMKRLLQCLNHHFHEIVDTVKSQNPGITLRTALVGYRDACDGLRRREAHDFQDDPNETADFIATIKAWSNSKSGPKDVFGGLALVADLEWKADVRVMLHIANMPCHGKKYYLKDLNDSYPYGVPNDYQLRGLLRGLRDKNVRYFFLRMSPNTDLMVKIFNRIVNVERIDLSDPEVFVPVVVSTITGAIKAYTPK